MKEYKEYDEEKLLKDDNLKKTYGFSNKYEEQVNSMYTKEQLYEMAKKRVALKHSFMIHLAAYLSTLALVWFVTGWYVTGLVALGWGIGIVCHGVSTSMVLNKQRHIAREMKNLEDESKR